MEARVAGWRPARAFAVVVGSLALTACADLPLPPELESAGDPGAPIYLASGPFQKSEYLTTGRATYTLDGQGRAALDLSPDFSTPPVPRVSLFLTDTGRLDEAVKVGPLEGPTGPQRWTFSVPRGAVWRWALLWSEELWVEVARARLEP